ncbi:MAG TPA: ABC transporter substrate-binding protein, partial [Kiloniellales bacterium]|nr:ABC transporter substrate-binding protein [Kiloniellales bacterium]
MIRKPMIYALLLGTAVGVASLEASAQTLRFASQSDALTLDPHAQNEGPTITMSMQFYDPLIIRDNDMGIRPGLA